MIQQARIPQRYAHCTLDSYDTQFPSSNRTLTGALVQARGFVDGISIRDNNGNGLLLTGSIGVGKTHLAVGMLQALVAERGATRPLLRLPRPPQAGAEQLQPQRQRHRARRSSQPVFDAEVLVLDELGASKPTDWVWDTVAHILNTRYNDRRTTIITTNYANLAPLASDATGPTRVAVREETLGDRIGERMRSRLQEMCVVVEMTGEDFRQKVKRASFA